MSNTGFDEFVTVPPGADCEETSRIRAVTLYSDGEDLQLARDLISRLSKKLGDTTIDHSPWNCRLLCSASLRLIASLEAWDADIIIVSVNARGEFGEDAQAWIQMALEQGSSHERALVFLSRIEGKPAEELRLCRFLRDAAAANGLAFFCQTRHETESPSPAPGCDCTYPIQCSFHEDWPDTCNLTWAENSRKGESHFIKGS